jgi:YesN/AraC family two-component response regulator
MKLFIKNMICLSCQMVVRSEIEKLDLYCTAIGDGWVETDGTLSADQIIKLKTALLKAGLELIDNKKAILIEKIKNAILDMLNNSDIVIKTSFSYYLSKKLDLDYTYLANMFSEHQGSTIENFIIINRVKKVKQLICNRDLNLTEISWQLNYSSVAHLSTQFKKVTGITPSHFKHIEYNSLLPSMCEL